MIGRIEGVGKRLLRKLGRMGTGQAAKGFVERLLSCVEEHVGCVEGNTTWTLELAIRKCWSNSWGRLCSKTVL